MYFQRSVHRIGAMYDVEKNIVRLGKKKRPDLYDDGFKDNSIGRLLTLCSSNMKETVTILRYYIRVYNLQTQTPTTP